MRRGRRRKAELERYPSGKITRGAREEDVRKPVRAQRRRLLHVVRGQEDDPELESITGRLHRAGILEDIQFHAARALAHAIRGFVSVAGGPRFSPKISGVYQSPQSPQPSETIAEMLNVQAERYLKALADLDSGERQLVWAICIEEREVVLDQPEIDVLKSGLTRLISNIRR